MINNLVLTGNLGADPKIHKTEKGTVARFDLAFKSSKENTGWIQIVAFNRLAEVCEKFLDKGSRIALSGKLQQERWQDDDGNNVTKYQVVANTIEFIKVRANDEDGQGQDETPF